MILYVIFDVDFFSDGSTALRADKNNLEGLGISKRKWDLVSL